MDIKTRLARLEKLRQPKVADPVYGCVQRPDGAVYITRNGRPLQWPSAILQMDIDEL